MVDYSDNPSMGFTDHIDQSWFEKTTLNADKSKLKKLMERVDHSKIDYEPFKKKFYIESFEISKMTDEEVDRFLFILIFCYYCIGISLKIWKVSRYVVKIVLVQLKSGNNADCLKKYLMC